MNWERVWLIISVLLLCSAAFFFWRNNLSAVFVTAALGACAWFLSYRVQLREKIVNDESDGDEERDER